MVKYHHNAELVKGIIADKKAAGQTEQNPDAKSLTMYYCWDSSAVVNDDNTTRAQELSSASAVSAEMAAAMLSGPKLFYT